MESWIVTGTGRTPGTVVPSEPEFRVDLKGWGGGRGTVGDQRRRLLLIALESGDAQRENAGDLLAPLLRRGIGLMVVPRHVVPPK